jgi:hypothetical protein
LKRVALRGDAPALALRGIAMAQLGDLVRAKALLRSTARAFAPKEAVARARCVVAEVALVSRDLGWPAKALDAARATLEAHGDPGERHANAPGGGITNAGTISAKSAAIFQALDAARATLEAHGDPGERHANAPGGGITNAGTISAKSAAIFLDVVSTFAGGIGNSGRIVAATGAHLSTVTLFSTSNPGGGITNSGTISAAADGFHLRNVGTFIGGIANSGAS